MSSPQTVTDLLDMRMRAHPDRTAFTFISGSSSAPACLSFASLASEARRIASELITLNSQLFVIFALPKLTKWH